MKKGNTDRDLIFEKKRQEAIEKNSTVDLLEIMIKKNYDVFYEIGRMQRSISEFKIKRLKKNTRRNKTIKRKNYYKRWSKKRRRISA